MKNWLHDAWLSGWKSVVSGGAGASTAVALPTLFPHCHLWVCVAAGYVVNNFVWGVLHGVGDKQQSSYPPSGPVIPHS